MQIHELSDLELLVHLSIAEDELFTASNTRKEILTEIRNRKDLLKEKLKRMGATVETVEGYEGNINKLGVDKSG